MSLRPAYAFLEYKVKQQEDILNLVLRIHYTTALDIEGTEDETEDVCNKCLEPYPCQTVVAILGEQP